MTINKRQYLEYEQLRLSMQTYKYIIHYSSEDTSSTTEPKSSGNHSSACLDTPYVHIPYSLKFSRGKYFAVLPNSA